MLHFKLSKLTQYCMPVHSRHHDVQAYCRIVPSTPKHFGDSRDCIRTTRSYVALPMSLQKLPQQQLASWFVFHDEKPTLLRSANKTLASVGAALSLSIGMF